MEVPANGTWRKIVRYKTASPTRQDPNRRVAKDLTGWNAKLQVRAKVTDLTALITMSTRGEDLPDVPLTALDATGEIVWAVDLSAFTLPKLALYELLVFEPNGLPHPLLEGQLVITPGVAVP